MNSMKIRHYDKQVAKKIHKQRPWTGVRKSGWYFFDRYHIWGYGPYGNENKCRMAAKKYFKVAGEK